MTNAHTQYKQQHVTWHSWKRSVKAAASSSSRMATVVATRLDSVDAYNHFQLTCWRKAHLGARAAAGLHTSVLVVLEAAKGDQDAVVLVPAPLHLASHCCNLLFILLDLCI